MLSYLLLRTTYRVKTHRNLVDRMWGAPSPVPIATPAETVSLIIWGNRRIFDQSRENRAGCIAHARRPTRLLCRYTSILQYTVPMQARHDPGPLVSDTAALVQYLAIRRYIQRQPQCCLSQLDFRFVARPSQVARERGSAISLPFTKHASMKIGLILQNNQSFWSKYPST